MIRGHSHDRLAGRASAVAVGAALLTALCAPSALLAQEGGEGEEVALEEPSPSAPPTGDGLPTAEPPIAPPADAPVPPAALEGSDPANEEAPAPLAIAAGAGGVTMADYSYSPATVTVSVGDTVTWTNAGPDEPHTATGEGFDTGTVAVGASGSATFGSAGSFPYVCTLHPGLMSGTVVVEAAGGAGGSDTDAPEAPADETSEAAAIAAPDAAGTASKLPATGLGALPLALVGFALLAAGGWLRRRA